MKDSTTNNGQGQTKVCRAAPAMAVTWTESGTAPGQTTMEEVVGLWDTKSTTSLTAHLLKERADRIKNLLQRTSSGTYLGTIESGTCSAARGQGMCVKYEAAATATAGDTIDTIKWLGKLYSVAEKLEKHEKAVQRRREATAAIKTKAELLKTLIHVVPAKQATQTDRQPLSQTKQQEQELEVNRKDCGQHKKKTTKAVAKKQESANGKEKLKQKETANLKMEKEREMQEQGSQLQNEQASIPKIYARLSKERLIHVRNLFVDRLKTNAKITVSSLIRN
uniref:Variant surface glycoprotein 1125.5595 n=1 Tax=Trypanosoma brucei TaxID=5691 RepID=A0A1J0RCV3_9TRYP|nr:variant surface glycoprotein 1125.5595 [Trypanosoma brucei]